MVPGVPVLGLRERCLLWLARLDQSSSQDSGYGATQPGISAATGLSRAHVSRTLSPLLAERLVEAHTTRVAGVARRRVTYQITPLGREAAAKLRDALLDVEVEVRQAGVPAGRMTLRNVLSSSKAGRSEWDFLAQLWNTGHVDPNAGPTTTAHDFQRLLEEAPAPEAFVGRERELKQVRDWLHSGQGTFWVTGSPGIGKSTLVAKALSASPPPPVHLQWIRITHWTTEESLAREIDKLLARLGRSRTVGELDPRMMRQWFGNLPAVLVLDDVHKATPELQRYLTDLAASLENSRKTRALFVGRDAETIATGPAQPLRVPPIPPPEAAQLLAGFGVSKEDQGPLIEDGQGNPLFLRILAHSSDRTRSRYDLQDYLRRDVIDRLDDVSRGILQWISALRTPATNELLRHVEASPAEVERLCRRELLHRRPDGSLDVHDMVREAVYGTLDAPRRQELHRRLADWFRPRGDDWSSVEEHLFHLVRAGDRGAAVRWLFANQSRFLARMEQTLGSRGEGDASAPRQGGRAPRA